MHPYEKASIQERQIQGGIKEYIEKEWETGANVGFSKIEWSIAAQQVWFSVD